MNSPAKIARVVGRAVPLRGVDIDTDRIIPARFLRCVTFDGLGEHAFEDDRKDPEHAFNQARYQGASILFVGRNFGCGSSREHAPQALMRWGVRGIVGESFAEIFFGNCQAMGIPCFTASAEEVETLHRAAEEDPEQEFSMDVASGRVAFGEAQVQGQIPDGAREALLTGAWNATLILLEAGDQIEAAAARLPYLAGLPAE